MAASSAPGVGEYAYNDDYTIGPDEHGILLPGLDAQPAIASWRGGDDWLLPGVVGRSAGSSSEDDDDDSDVTSASSNEGGGEPDAEAEGDGDGEDSHRIEGYGSGAHAGIHTPTSADMHHQHEATWILQIVPATSAAVRAAVGESVFGQPGLVRTEGPGVSGAGHAGGPAGRAHQQLRLLPTSALRSSSFGPFGTNSLQHRDSLNLNQQHPLTLAVQHHHRFPPSPPRQPHLQSETQQLQRDLRGEAPGAVSAHSGGLGPGASGRAAGDSGGVVGTAAGAAGASTWPFVPNVDPFTPNRASLSSSSSSSSSAASSPQTSPARHQAGAGSYPAQPAPGRRAGSGPQPPWMASQYPNAAQYEQQFGLSAGLDRMLPSSGATTPMERERRVQRPGLRVTTIRSGGVGMERLDMGLGSPASTDSFGSAGSPRRQSSSRESWIGEEGDASSSRLEDSLPGGGGGQLPVLWPMGRSSDHPTASGYASGLTPSAAAAPGMTSWRPAPGAIRPSHHPQPRLVSGRGGPLGPGWRPPRLDTLQDGMAETSWDHHFGALSTSTTSTSFGLSTGTTSASIMAANRASILVGSPRSSQVGSLLARPGSSGMGSSVGGLGGAGGSGGSSLPPLLGHRGPGGGSGGGPLNAAAAGGTTRCFTSIDSPPGPYERRRVVLTSAQRRSPPSADPATPTVRQYSEGLAGVLTNAQIQEWMSQHASRLLLPRHMHEIADIVFRPPSAVPEKKPPKLQPGNGAAAVLSPPVVLGGRYPPPHITRIVVDAGYVASLLGSLVGVDPANSRVVAMVTALQGKDLTVSEEGAEQGAQQTQLLREPSLQRLPSKAPTAVATVTASPPQLLSTRQPLAGQ